MILAGDIGGTKTNLALFEVRDGSLAVQREQSFVSRNYASLNAIVAEFVASPDVRVTSACFGIAGPILDGRSTTPNLPWVVDSSTLADELHLESVLLLNDVESTAHGIAELKPEELLTLNEGVRAPGNCALVAAGTGFGVAALLWNGKSYDIVASEGGHADFAPRNELEIGLLRFLQKKHERVSVERVVSGPGLYNIYDFLRSTGYAPELSRTADQFRDHDPGSVISRAALAGEDPLAVKSLDMLTAIYGATTGNLALTLIARGGVYIGGGVAPKIRDKLTDGTFMQAFADKGRLQPLMNRVPVHVILNEKTALLGAARVGASGR